jgi:hypothetical protein
MQCLRCGFQNKVTNQYCERCGSALGIECSACGRVNGPEARFCGNCSRALRGNAPAAANQPWQQVLRSLHAKGGERIRARKIDVIVVYKVDRLTRSLADFAKLVELFDAHGVSFVSVTQQFNTTTSMGRLTLNVLLSFAQFEREVTSERIRDKIAASKRKGIWVGGNLPLGYEMKDGKIAIIEEEAELVRSIFRRYLELGGVNELLRDLRERNIRTKTRRLPGSEVRPP